MPWFRQKIRKAHLLDGSIGLEIRGTLAERVEYAWKVYNSSKTKYTPEHKAAARQFLTTTFKIPTGDTEEGIKRTLTALLLLKAGKTDKTYVPSLAPSPCHYNSGDC